MFWGNADAPFSCLIAFFVGYKMGCHSNGVNGVSLDELLPSSFTKFVAVWLGLDWHPAKNWFTYIREKTLSEDEAFEMFFSLRSSFNSTKKD